MSAQPQMEDFEEMFGRTKAYLMTANKDGVSVYDQLTRLMEKLLDENPHDIANDPSRFNEIFMLLQEHSFVNGQSTPACNEPCSVPPSELKRLAENQTLFDRPPPETITTIEQPDPYTTVTTTKVKPRTAPPYDSVAQNNLYWAWAGCGMAEEEAFLLDRSITKLAMEKKLEEVRFVGKIFGTKGNYYIVSSRRYVQEDEKVYKEVNTMPRPARRKLEVPVQPEPGFVGVNRLSFWVTSHPASEWNLLPDVTPQQISAGRRIKRLFSGELNANIVSSPPFEWNEAIYLRVQLSRIISGTYISPSGALEEPEEDGEEEEEEYDDEDIPKKPKEARYRPLTQYVKGFASEEDSDVTQWSKLDQWVHSEGYIYENGRQTKVPEKPEEDEEEEEQQQQEEEEEEHEEEVEEEEEEEKELFTPIRSDNLYAVINIPEAPKVDDEDEEDEELDAQEEEKEGTEEDNNNDMPPKPVTDDEIPDDDPTKVKVPAWTIRVVNNNSKKHRVVVVRSLRWPGAIAFAAEGGKKWGSVYFGNGLKKTDFSFTPTLAPPVLSECADITEVRDPTPATEKLVRRGEDPPEPDSEDEPADEEGEEADDM